MKRIDRRRKIRSRGTKKERCADSSGIRRRVISLEVSKDKRREEKRTELNRTGRQIDVLKFSSGKRKFKVAS